MPLQSILCLLQGLAWLIGVTDWRDPDIRLPRVKLIDLSWHSAGPDVYDFLAGTQSFPVQAKPWNIIVERPVVAVVAITAGVLDV